MRGLSLLAASGGHSSSWCAGLSLSRPLVAEHRLQTRRLSSCGSRAQLLRGMWDLPRLGLEPVSPALAGRFSTTVPPGKPYILFYILFHYGLSQEIGYSSLCYTVGPCCLSILNVTVCIYYPRTPNPSLPLPPLHLGNHKSVLYVCESLSVSQIGSFVPYFRFHM